MNVTVEKLKNPYNITFDLSSGRDDVIGGSIVIDNKPYYLPVISRDIADCLIAVTDKGLFINLPQEFIFQSVDELPEYIKKEALEVKLRLMACNAFQEMDKTNRAKLEAIETYYAMRHDEREEYARKMAEIDLWLHRELDRIDNEIV